MKKSLFLMAGLAIAFASCQKDESMESGSINADHSSNRSGTSASTTVPSVFTKKVLAEEFSGAAYGDAPMSNSTLSSITSNYPNTVYVASFHDNDILETNATDGLKNTLPGGTGAGFPSSSINRTNLSGSRFVSYGDYSNMVNMCMQTTTNCGLMISSRMSGNTASITITAGFNANVSGNYSVNAYLVEDQVADVTGTLAQSNNFTSVHSSPFYNMGNPIYGYTHNNVVRRMITPLNGTPISASGLAAGATTAETYFIDLPDGINRQNCSIIAFITEVNNGIADKICNVQKAPLGTFKGWN